MSNMEYIDLFISKVTIFSKARNEKVKDIDFTAYKPEQIEELL